MKQINIYVTTHWVILVPASAGTQLNVEILMSNGSFNDDFIFQTIFSNNLFLYYFLFIMFENYSSLNGRFLQRALGFITPLCRETICPTSAIQFYSFANDTVFYFSVNNTFLFTMNNTVSTSLWTDILSWTSSPMAPLCCETIHPS